MNQAVAFTLDPTRSLGQIAVNVPGSTAVFRRLKLDFCCGGEKSLQTAADEKRLDVDGLLKELAALRPRDAAVPADEPGALIDHILTRYHETHRAQLPELIRMARRVEAVHADHPATPAGLARLLTGIESEMLAHMQKEEQVLFPMLKSGGNPFVVHPIHMMRTEHTEHGESLERIAAITHDMTPPAGACTTWRALYAGLAQFSDDLINHIHLENNVLFPMFEAKSESGCATTGGCGCAG